MSTGRQPSRSHLFTVRIWAEDLGHGQAEWRGRVQHVTSGQTHYFRDWDARVKLLATLLDEVEPEQRPALAKGEPATEAE